MTSLLPAFTILLTQTAGGDPTLGNFWYTLPLGKRVSPFWERLRATTEAEIAKTRSLPVGPRHAALAKVNRAVDSSRPEAIPTYRAAAYWLAFRNEWRTAVGSLNVTPGAFVNSFGAKDPEYFRVMYGASCISQGTSPWKPDLGRKLAAMFPWDRTLDDARIYDATLTQPDAQKIGDGFVLLERLRQAGMDRMNYIRRRSSLNSHLYELTRSRKALETTITDYEEIERTISDPIVKRRAKVFLEAALKDRGRADNTP